MQIFVTTPGGTATAYQVEPDMSVAALKSMIENNEFMPAEIMRLVNGTTTLSGGLLCNHVEEDDILTMMMDVDGGMRAKWRKKRMRRLRRKRRKMRQRAR